MNRTILSIFIVAMIVATAAFVSVVLYYIKQDVCDVAFVVGLVLFVTLAPPLIAESIKKWQRGRG